MVLQILGVVSGIFLALIVLHFTIYIAFRAAVVGIRDAHRHADNKQKEKLSP